MKRLLVAIINAITRGIDRVTVTIHDAQRPREIDEDDSDS